MERIRHGLDWLRARLWLLPALMSAAALISAYLMLASEAELIERSGSPPWWLFSGDAGTARDLLSTFLSGIITMTSLVVSITIVVLSLSAGQLGPRLIWNFIGDRQIQVVIGLFMATILYTLVVLRSINDELGAGAVPHLAITVASLLVISCLFALLFHVNKLARSIVSDTMVDEVAGTLDAAIARLPTGAPDGADDKADGHTSPAASIALERSGYVQYVDYSGLCRFAAEKDMLVRLEVRPGQFVLRGCACASVCDAGPLADDDMTRIRSAVALGSERTPSQDLEYTLRQLVEIAVRALSPSLNDPFTAVAVVDRLAAALEAISRHRLPDAEFRDDGGRLRVLAHPVGFDDLVDTAFAPIRRAAASQVEVLVAMAARFSDLLDVLSGDKRIAIVSQMRHLRQLAQALPQADDRAAVLAIVDASSAGHLAPAGRSARR